MDRCTEALEPSASQAKGVTSLHPAIIRFKNTGTVSLINTHYAAGSKHTIRLGCIQELETVHLFTQVLSDIQVLGVI